MTASKSETLLRVENLKTSFTTEFGKFNVVDGVSFEVGKGETLGIVGESGCGKSITSLSVIGLLPKPHGRIESGKVLYRGEDLSRASKERMWSIRGRKISMIFQEPMTALNPLQPVGKQIGEVYRLHFPQMKTTEIQLKSLAMLKKVGIPEPEVRMFDYPHQLSGGMRQRVMIAIALACEPDILIADEPTTALDVTIQAQILTLMKDLQVQNGMAIMFITHDLGVIAEMCHKVLVMYAGKSVEQAPAEKIFEKPCHPYTLGLLRSVPKLESVQKAFLPVIDGMVPRLDQLPDGCRFENRCQFASELCKKTPPSTDSVRDGHMVSCHHWKSAAERVSD